MVEDASFPPQASAGLASVSPELNGPAPEPPSLELNCEPWGFGPFDIRAVVDERFNAGYFYRLGQSFARLLRAESLKPADPHWVALGFDARTHSPELSEALTAGLQAEGLQVLNIGLVPTPLVYFAQWLSLQPNKPAELPLLTGCLMVTASHNPSKYNGVKFSINQQPPSAQQMQQWQQHLRALPPAPRAGAVTAPSKVTKLNLSQAYIASLQQEFGTLGEGLTIVMDGSNGSGGPLAVKALEALGAKVLALYCKPDGAFPNHPPDPCRPENLKALSQAVKQYNADWGFCLDGDADRLGVVDEAGQPLTNDTLLAALAEAVLATAPEANRSVVCEIKAPAALLKAVEAAGGTPVLSPTGHVFMKQQMKASEAWLGGELSGHFFFRDRHPGYDDALYTACRLLQAYRNEGPASLQDCLPSSLLSPEYRLPCPKNQQMRALETLKFSVTNNPDLFGQEVTEVLTLDGVRVNWPGGFCLLRPSNTEPVLSLRFEAETQEGYQAVAQVIQALLSPYVSEADLAPLGT